MSDERDNSIAFAIVGVGYCICRCLVANVNISNFDEHFVTLKNVGDDEREVECPYGYDKRVGLHPDLVRAIVPKANLKDSEARNAGVLFFAMLEGMRLGKNEFLATSEQSFLDDPPYLKCEKENGYYPSSIATRDGMRGANKKLIGADYLVEVIAGNSDWGPKVVRPSDELRASLTAIDPSRVRVIRARLAESAVIIKNMSGKYIDPTDCDRHFELTNELSIINAHIQRQNNIFINL
jgi:hypothetical protein